MDGSLNDFVLEILKQTNPALFALVVPTSGLVKLAVDAVKGLKPDWQGNVLQSVTAGVAVAATLVQAAGAGIFQGGLTPQEGMGLMLLATVVWLGAIGIHEVTRNRNAVAERLDDLKAQLQDREPVNCTRPAGHDGPCNGWPCESRRREMSE